MARFSAGSVWPEFLWNSNHPEAYPRWQTVKRIVLLVVFLISLPIGAHAWTGKVVSVIDGDSLTVFRAGYGEVEIRLYGIDAPEFDQAFGRAAKKHLAAIIFRRKVDVETLDRDKHDRSVAILRQNGLNVNEMVVRDGYAWVYRHYCKRRICHDWLRLETAARQKKIGLWQKAGPVPPWEFRHMK
jgi:micrococcal nuclease